MSIIDTHSKRAPGKDRPAYWMTRVELRMTKINGEVFQNKEYSVRIKFEGRREWFPLHSATQVVAAKLACDIYLSLVRFGWAATVAKFKPSRVRVESSSVAGPTNSPRTLGEFIALVTKFSPLRGETKVQYIRKVRTVVAAIMSIQCKGRFRTRDEGYAAWKAKVDAVELAQITPERIKRWRNSQVTALDEDEVAQQARSNTIKSLLRSARALFSKNHTDEMTVTINGERPFHGFPIGAMKLTRYTSMINVPELLAFAVNELKESDVDAYLILWLGLFAGLRRSEIDRLQWKDIDTIQKDRIWVRAADKKNTKTSASEDYIRVTANFIEELIALRPKNPGSWVVEPSSTVEEKIARRRRYRADESQKRLIRWLRAKGLNRRKPLHELRKEFGSIINDKFGLHAAMVSLRHSSIAMTAAVYTDRRTVATVDPAAFRSVA